MAIQAFLRATQKFLCRGLSLLPADLLVAGKFAYLLNVRSYEEGTLVPRHGLQVASNALGGSLHTIARLNDATPFNGGVPALRILGAGTNIFAAAPGAGVYPIVDAGYSGNPLTALAAVPVRSPQPWLYVADSARQRKFATDGKVYPIGIAQPTAPSAAPTVTLRAPQATTIASFDSSAGWAAVGAIAGAPATANRVSTTIAAIVYDSGATGYASCALTGMTNITTGMYLTIAGAEVVLVTDILIAVAATTIASIIYDAGASGACTIQPTASLGVGQLEGPALANYLQRFYPLPGMDQPLASPIARIRQVDFPVNCLVTLAGAETVRITSVALGPDGVQSFRCVTAGTRSAGDAISGLAGFRAAFAGTRVPGDSAVANVVQQVLTPTDTAAVVGGLQSAAAVNLARVGTQATQADDNIHLAVRVDKLSAVTEIRLYLDVNAAAADFVSNYFFKAWRANDIITAIQATNAAVVVPVTDARTEDVIPNNQVDQPITLPDEPIPLP